MIRSHKRKTVAHRTRSAVNSHHPLHVTMKLRKGLPKMRRRTTYMQIERAIRAGNDRFGFRLCHFTVLSNHFHFIVEAKDKRALALGMQGLAIRIAKALNRTWKRRGQVFAERYYALAIDKYHKIRRVLLYVLQNARRHGVPVPKGLPDAFSSAPWYIGWNERRDWTTTRPSPVVEPKLSMLQMYLWRFSVNTTPLLTLM